MSDTLQDTDPPFDPVAALSNIQDDDSPRHDAERWAAEALIEGRQAEELISQLTDEGWDADEAEQIVETARKATRHERGVVTREDVVRELNANYRRATGGLSVAFRSGLFGLYGFTTSVMAAVRSVRKLSQLRKK